MTIKTLIVGSLICLIFTGMVVLLVIAIKPMRPEWAPLGNATNKFESMAVCLTHYYDRIGTTGEQFRQPDVLAFLQKECGLFSSKISVRAPVPPHVSPYDFGVYLCLPSKLESDLPTLIAYSTAIRAKDQIPYRVALFLRKTTTTVVTVRCDVMEKIVKREPSEELPPDFYFCESRVQQ